MYENVLIFRAFFLFVYSTSIDVIFAILKDMNDVIIHSMAWRDSFRLFNLTIFIQYKVGRVCRRNTKQCDVRMSLIIKSKSDHKYLQTLQHRAVCAICNCEYMWWNLMTFYALVSFHDFLRIDWKLFVRIYDDTKQARVCLKRNGYGKLRRNNTF